MCSDWVGLLDAQSAGYSAARGGGLLSGIGILPIGLGAFLACFSLLTLALTGPRGRISAWTTNS